MADQLYLSLWYPNFRLEMLPAALTGVLRQFAVIGGKRVAAASAYPISFSEAPTYQRIYVSQEPAPGILPSAPPEAALGNPTEDLLEAAVAEATEPLHDDMAYEFEMRWQLWTPESALPNYNRLDIDPDPDPEEPPFDLDHHDPSWKLESHRVRVLGFGPRFDMAGFEQNGHLLVDFGLDTPWVLETLGDQPLDFPA